MTKVVIPGYRTTATTPDVDPLEKLADEEAEEARMKPEHLDPEDHATQMFR